MRTKLLLLWLLFAGALQAQTLGDTVQQIRDQSQAVLSRNSSENTWGEQTAAADLKTLEHSASSLLQELEGDDAKNVLPAQRDLFLAASRVRVSASLLPEAEKPPIEELLRHCQAVDQRLTQLRSRFAQKASRVQGPLADQPLEAKDHAFELYENPRALLIDVRDARQLASSLQTGRNPRWGFELNQPNNLDPLRVQRMIQAGWALQRGLEGNFTDIQEIYPLWEKFRFEYDRLGYPGSNHVTRQLERVMQRLGDFFQAVAS